MNACKEEKRSVKYRTQCLQWYASHIEFKKKSRGIGEEKNKEGSDRKGKKDEGDDKRTE